MSKMCTDSAQPWLLNSLTELSQALDRATTAPEPPLVIAATPAAEELPILTELPTCVAAQALGRRRRRTPREGWLLGLAGLGGLWVLYCGAMVMGASAKPA